MKDVIEVIFKNHFETNRFQFGDEISERRIILIGEFIIEFVHDVRYNETGVNLANLQLTKRIPLKSMYIKIKGYENLNPEPILKDLYQKSLDHIKLNANLKVNETSIAIAESLLVINDFFSEIKETLSE